MFAYYAERRCAARVFIPTLGNHDLNNVGAVQLGELGRDQDASRCRATRPPARRSATSRSTTATRTSSSSTRSCLRSAHADRLARRRPRHDHAQVEVRLPAPHAVLVRQRHRVDRQQRQRAQHLGAALRAVRRRRRLRSATTTSTSARSSWTTTWPAAPRHRRPGTDLHHDRRRRRDARRRRQRSTAAACRTGSRSSSRPRRSATGSPTTARRPERLLQLRALPVHRR